MEKLNSVQSTTRIWMSFKPLIIKDSEIWSSSVLRIEKSYTFCILLQKLIPHSIFVRVECIFQKKKKSVFLAKFSDLVLTYNLFSALPKSTWLLATNKKDLIHSKNINHLTTTQRHLWQQEDPEGCPSFSNSHVLRISGYYTQTPQIH